MKKNEDIFKKSKHIDPEVVIERLLKKSDSFDNKMKEVRRDYIQKSANSEKNASELVLNS